LKVLLKQDIDRVGRMGELVNVAGGYARNYLVPRGLAVEVTRGRMKEIEEQKKVLEVRAARHREQVQALADKVVSKRVAIKARCSATGKLFGSITNRQVAQAIAEQTGEDVDRHKIIIDDRIRAVGTYHALIKLHPDVEIDLEFEVEGEGFVAEEPEVPPQDVVDESELNADAKAEISDQAAADFGETAEATDEPAFEAVPEAAAGAVQPPAADADAQPAAGTEGSGPSLE